MGLWFELMWVAAGFNVLLLVGLGLIWARNYGQFRSKHTLGLLVFAILMLVENGLALYFYTMDPTLSSWFPQTPELPQMAMMSHRLLTLGALLFLVWVTWD